uniref:hypothetical protein n=1 Tax=Neorhizobium sp. EC2-8 TaxID=3129230 RepID=UPI003100AE14
MSRPIDNSVAISCSSRCEKLVELWGGGKVVGYQIISAFYYSAKRHGRNGVTALAPIMPEKIDQPHSPDISCPPPAIGNGTLEAGVEFDA